MQSTRSRDNLSLKGTEGGLWQPGNCLAHPDYHTSPNFISQYHQSRSYKILARYFKLTVYALVIQMNSVTARGSSGFLSGCFIRLNLLYAFLISFISAFGSTPRIWKGSKDLSGLILLTWSAVSAHTNQKNTTRATLIQNPLRIHFLECTFSLYLITSWQRTHQQLFELLNSSLTSPLITLFMMPKVNGTRMTVRIAIKKQQNALSSQSRSFSSSRWKLSWKLDIYQLF